MAMEKMFLSTLSRATNHDTGLAMDARRTLTAAIRIAVFL